MNLAATRIFTDDVDALVEFYETATGITAARPHPLFAELRTSTGTLAIASTQTVPLLGTPTPDARSTRRVPLDSPADPDPETHRALHAVVDTFVNEPTDMPWGNRSLLIRDPDGTLINFFTPTRADARERFAQQTP